MFVSWPAEKSLFGIDTSGKLSTSADGKTWQQLTAVPGGESKALTAVSADHILAATTTGVYESRDGGRTFTELAAARFLSSRPPSVKALPCGTVG